MICRMPKSMKARSDHQTSRQYGRVSQPNKPVIQRLAVNENVPREDVQAGRFLNSRIPGSGVRIRHKSSLEQILQPRLDALICTETFVLKAEPYTPASIFQLLTTIRSLGSIHRVLFVPCVSKRRMNAPSVAQNPMQHENNHIHILQEEGNHSLTQVSWLIQVSSIQFLRTDIPFKSGLTGTLAGVSIVDPVLA
jgi:hypothetical protein